jgi:predicted transcriptional regulator of viral defense system
VATAGRIGGLYDRVLDPPDRRLAEIASAQAGVVSYRQAAQAGLSATAVQKRVAAGRLHRVHRRVYAVGHPRLSASGRRIAAVLACGEGAGVSHLTAADQLAVLPSAGPRIHVVVPSRAGRAVAGMTVHRSGTLMAADVEPVDGVPTTTPARTLLDLADVVGRGRLVRALETADRLGLLDARALDETLRRGGARPAAHRLRAVLADFTGEPAPTRRELERRVLALFAQAGMARPRVNALVETRAGSLEVDFHWPDRRLVVEADSWEFHRGRAAFEEDRRRDQLLKLAGWERVRITWRQVSQRPWEVVEAVR